MILSEYPRTVHLEGHKGVTIRPMQREDEKPLLDFFRALPESERTLLRHDVTNSEVVRSWAQNLDYCLVLPLLALSGRSVLGNATLHRHPYGWDRHVGDIRIIIAPRARRMGLARVLAGEIVRKAQEAGVEKLLAQVATDQVEARQVFTRLGFREEAVLRNHIKDTHGLKHDLLLMSNDVSRLWDRWKDTLEGVSGPAYMED